MKMNVDVNDCVAIIKPIEEFSPIFDNCFKDHITKGVQNLTELVDWFRNRDQTGRDLERWKTMKDEVIKYTPGKQKPGTGASWFHHCIGTTQTYVNRISSCVNKVNSVLSEPGL